MNLPLYNTSCGLKRYQSLNQVKRIIISPGVPSWGSTDSHIFEYFRHRAFGMTPRGLRGRLLMQYFSILLLTFLSICFAIDVISKAIATWPLFYLQGFWLVLHFSIKWFLLSTGAMMMNKVSSVIQPHLKNLKLKKQISWIYSKSWHILALMGRWIWQVIQSRWISNVAIFFDFVHDNRPKFCKVSLIFPYENIFKFLLYP
jgi:hypothetical protein